MIAHLFLQLRIHAELCFKLDREALSLSLFSLYLLHREGLSGSKMHFTIRQEGDRALTRASRLTTRAVFTSSE